MEAAGSHLLRSWCRVIRLSYTRNVACRTICSQPKSRRAAARYAILGAGFSGLSVAWHLLQHHSSMEYSMNVDIFDESGIGGGASGVSGGLLHPYSAKGKLLWRGSESWIESLKLLAAAESAVELRCLTNASNHDQSCSFDGPIILRRGILRPATAKSKIENLKANAQNCLTSCPSQVLDGQAAACLVPNLIVPSDFAVHMPLALNIHSKRYLQALFMACKMFADEVSATTRTMTTINVCQKHINSLQELYGEYDAVVICLGAKAGMLPELSSKLPLRKCRGIIAELELPADAEEYGDQSPSIMTDAWVAFQGRWNALMGSTWEWGSDDHSSCVRPEEASKAYKDLVRKVSAIYPDIKKWEFVRARAGTRAMPPVTLLGSLPILGCVSGVVGHNNGDCQYWLAGGLGARGLLYHGLVGKLMARAMVSSDETVIPPELTSWKNKLIHDQTL